MEGLKKPIQIVEASNEGFDSPTPLEMLLGICFRGLGYALEPKKYMCASMNEAHNQSECGIGLYY